MNVDFTADELAQLNRNMQPTPDGVREDVLSQFPPPIKIGFGIEVELHKSHFNRMGLPGRLSLGRAPGFDVQTDNAVWASGVTYPEHVQKPRYTWEETKGDVILGAVDFNDRLVEHAFAAGKNDVTMGEVLPGVKAEYASLEIELGTPLPMDNIQATHGVVEAEVPAMYDSFAFDFHASDSEIAVVYNDLTDKMVLYAEGRLRKLKPEVKEFSADVYGFLTQVARLALEASASRDRPTLPKAHFRFNPRTALSWRYHCNLSKEDRQPVRGILLKAGKRPTLLSEALIRLDPAENGPDTDHFFASPYLGPAKADGSRDTFDGPTRDEVFESIVQRVYDLLCDLEGWGRDSEIGAWVSGDIEHHTAGVEQRDIGLIPSSNVLEPVVKALYRLSSRLNPRLKGLEEQREHDSQEWTACTQMSKAVDAFNRMHWNSKRMKTMFPQRAANSYGESVQMGVSAKPPNDLRDMIDSKEGQSGWDRVRAAYQDLGDYLRSDPQAMETADIAQKMKELGLALHDCDAQGAGRRERQAAVTAQSGA